MIIRFSCGIVKADHKSIFLSKSCEIIFMEISHIFTQYFHLSNRVIPAHRMSRWKILFLFKGMVRMMHETRNHHRVMRVARQLPALNDQNQRRDFWEGSCLYLAINQTQGKGRGWRLLQVMDCWLATILISSVHLTSLHSDGYFCISGSGFRSRDIFISDLKWSHC